MYLLGPLEVQLTPRWATRIEELLGKIGGGTNHDSRLKIEEGDFFHPRVSRSKKGGSSKMGEGYYSKIEIFVLPAPKNEEGFTKGPNTASFQSSIWKNGPSPSEIWAFKRHFGGTVIHGSGIWDPRSEISRIEITRTDRALARDAPFLFRWPLGASLLLWEARPTTRLPLSRATAFGFGLTHLLYSNWILMTIIFVSAPSFPPNARARVSACAACSRCRGGAAAIRHGGRQAGRGPDPIY